MRQQRGGEQRTGKSWWAAAFHSSHTLDRGSRDCDTGTLGLKKENIQLNLGTKLKVEWFSLR